MGSASKAKGNSGERELAKLLSGIFGGSFQRVIGSGAFTGGKNVIRKTTLSETQIRMHRGDIVPPDHLPKLVIESKSYAEFPFHAFLTPGPIPLLEKWLMQCKVGTEPDDFWFVSLKVNRKGWVIIVPVGNVVGMTCENHARYRDTGGTSYVVTDLISFLIDNKDLIALRAGTGK